MNVAFYAPLKSPDNPVPSGDRLIGRMLVEALRRAGHDVRVVSRLRTFDRDGDAHRQERIAAVGRRMAARITRRFASGGWHPDVWLTYHLYHKAPDWIGPAAARAARVPYCVVEASSTPRQAEGRWAIGHRAVAAALSEAALVVNINPKDEAGVRALVAADARLVTLPPFIDGEVFRAGRAARPATRMRLAVQFELDTESPWLLAVGMLRPGDKARSYDVLARAMSKLADRTWQLLVVGDGEARPSVEAMFRDVADRVRFVGARSTGEVADLMGACDLLVWPGVNEAIGMVFIEAAMAGLPVIGPRRTGTAAVVEDGRTGVLVAEGDVAAFADGVALLLDDPGIRQQMAAAAAARAAANDITTAGLRFSAALEAIRR